MDSSKTPSEAQPDPTATLNLIFENSPAYLTFLRGPEFVIERANKKSLELLQRSDIIGKTVLEALPEVEAQGYIQILSQVYHSKEPYYGTEIPLHLINTGSGEKQLYIDFIYQPLVDSRGNVSGIISQGYDVTEKVMMKRQLEFYNLNLEKLVQERTQRLQALNEELESFSYSVSHDLRTPLRSIEGFSQALLEDESPRLSARGQSDLQRVVKASQSMGKLIDDLLNLSRMGRREMTVRPMSMEAVVRPIIQHLQEREPSRKVEFELGEMPQILGDPGLIAIAVENLLSNAWKFTAKNNAAQISLRYEDVLGEPAFVLRDNGVGFDMAYYDKLFGAFQRLHRTSEFQGTGVGLALVRRIINRHKGEIWAESRVDQGASFYFRIPLAE